MWSRHAPSSPPPAVAVRQASWRSHYVGSSPPSCALPMPAAPPPRWTSLGFHGFLWDSRWFNSVLWGIELDLMGFFKDLMGFYGIQGDLIGFLWDLMRLDFFIWLFWDLVGFYDVFLELNVMFWGHLRGMQPTKWMEVLSRNSSRNRRCSIAIFEYRRGNRFMAPVNCRIYRYALYLP